MRIALVVPHIFMNADILPEVIFSPGRLGLELASGLVDAGINVSLFSPGSVKTRADNVTADLSLFKTELAARGYGYIELLKKHPLIFVSMARQVQTELITKAYKRANNGEFDLVHIYTNEEELGLVMADLCEKPVVFTHHEPFNFLAKYRAIFPKYKHLNWLSLSYSQRKSMPADTNWVGNIYHGLPLDKFSYIGKDGERSSLKGKEGFAERGKGSFCKRSKESFAERGKGSFSKRSKESFAERGKGSPGDKSEGSSGEKTKKNISGDYLVYMGRIIKPKGVHLAIEAAKKAGIKLKIAGKHYSGHSKDKYWQQMIKPEIDGKHIEYLGFIKTDEEKQRLLGNAKALIMPSTWQEPFGMVMIEAMACGTPVIGLDNGAVSEVVEDGVSGILVATQGVVNSSQIKQVDDFIVENLADAIKKIDKIDRKDCRQYFENRFSLDAMVKGHNQVYSKLVDQVAAS